MVWPGPPEPTAMHLTLTMPARTEAREEVLRLLSASVFMLFFQNFMVAPLIPTLAGTFHATRDAVGLLIPAYTLPYALAALACGALADRYGRRGLLFFALASFPMVSLAMAAAPDLRWLLALRAVSGVSNVGIAVMGLSLVGDLFPAAERGRAIGWIFGAIAGGGAFGSTLGGVLAPWIGWRGLFVLVAGIGILLLVRMRVAWSHLASQPRPTPAVDPGGTLAGYASLLSRWRGARTYGYITLNAMFHSGVFTWIGVLLHDRFGLGETGIGLALLGYGVPGMVLGPAIGKIVDRHGRRNLIPAGLLIAASAAALLAPAWPLAVAVMAAPILSLGFDMSHPLFAGIATTIDDRRRGQAMGLNTFAIFFGLGCGSLLFGHLAHRGLPHALRVFAMGQAALGLLAIPIFRGETTAASKA